jgi:hypothetical protein
MHEIMCEFRSLLLFLPSVVKGWMVWALGERTCLLPPSKTLLALTNSAAAAARTNCDYRGNQVYERQEGRKEGRVTRADR